MMLKVLLVDDEKHICILLKKLVDWEAMDLTIVGEQYDGLSAYDYICTHEPEIVITDIKIPGIDGLEMIRRVREKKLNVSFILISGHKNFEYAHSAINYGVENYLLKPLNKDELTDNLISIRNRIFEEKDLIETRNTINSRIIRSTSRLHRQFLSDFIEKKKALRWKSLEEINEEYLMSFSQGYFRCIIIKPDARPDLNEAQLEIVNNKIKERFLYSLKPVSIEIEAVREFYGCFFLINYSDGKQLLTTLEDTLKDAYSRYKEYCHITACISTEKTSLDNQMIDESVKALQYRISRGLNTIVDTSCDDFEPFPGFDPIQLKNMEKALSVCDIKSITRLFSTLEKQIFHNVDPDSLFAFAEMLFDLLARNLQNLYNDQKEMGFNKRDARISLLDEKDLTSVLKKIRDYFIKELSDFNDYNEQRSSSFIVAAKKYVAENYSKNISLEQVSKIVYMSPTYFSSLFKQNEGMNFSDYIILYRVNKAKELLKENMYNISDVTYQVGYSDPKYFSKLFKKIIGITPSEYRKLYV